jgi:high-affinity iron transporter
LDEALRAYRAGDREHARQLAIAGYLEGFELIEGSLDNVDAPLRIEAERQMMTLRSAITAGEPVETVGNHIRRIEALLRQADEKLSGGSLSATTAFVSSLLILLREGLEAILVLAAIIAFVLKTGRRDALPYIHTGWAAALVAGLLTWVVAQYLLSISGANREMTAGVTALIAAAMLLYVGYWLHSKSYAQAWQAFIRDRVTVALGKRTLWAMAGISFVAVYRELFEVILFYEALWVQAGPQGRHAVLGGIAAAAIALALIGGLILKYSVRLLGIYPTIQSLLVQGVGLALVLVGVALVRRSGRVPRAAH